MFRGSTELAVDAKGRIAIPSRYRDLIQSEGVDGLLVVTRDTEECCLLIYPYPEWEVIEEKLESLPSYHPITRRIQRLLIGNATEVELDRNGRILIPPLLREEARLGSTVTLVGQGKKFELWDKSEWMTACKDWLNQDPPNEMDLPPEVRALSL